MEVKTILPVLVLGLADCAFSETNDVASLPAVLVWGEREFLYSVRADDELWRGTSSALSVRGQGEAGTIKDLSINGSSFSEAGIVFNGTTLRNVQTEHFNADLPVVADWLAQPQVLTGIALFRAGHGHPAGSLATGLASPEGRSGKVSLGVGLNGLVFGRVNDVEVFRAGDSGRVWVGAFADAAHADKVDGYESNPMDKASAGGRLGFGTELWKFDALVSWAWRDFGCTGAYGANEKYPAWEEDRTGLVSADWKYDAGDDQASELSALWTRGRDAYWLCRDNPGYYKNTHVADSVTLHGATRRHFSDWAFVDLRGDADAEIYSTTHHNNYSGTDPRAKAESFRRFHGSVAALPGVCLGDWEIAAGVAAELYSDYAGRCVPAGGIAYRPDEDTKFELSYREGMRQPSYTELTYDSPDSKGTRGLPLQRTRTLNLDGSFEGRGEMRRARGGLFLMQNEGLVDWLKDSPSSAWQATPMDPGMSFASARSREPINARTLTRRGLGRASLRLPFF